MDNRLPSIIKNTIIGLLESSVSETNITRMTKKHLQKIHFIPIKYRIIGGILQGLNIKFGNFIESLIQNIVEIDSKVQLMPDFGKRIRLFFTKETDSLIDAYITERQLPNSPDDC